MIGEWSSVALIAIGSIFSTLAAVGILRMPDLYMRIQAATKSSTLGVSCIVLASFVHLRDTGASTHAVLVIVFLFLTAPIAGHMIGRAAYTAGVPLWKDSIADELGGQAPRPVGGSTRPHDEV